MRTQPNFPLERHRTEYHHKGLTILSGLVPPAHVREWRHEIERSLQWGSRPSGGVHRIDREATGIESAGDGGGAYHHDILDGRAVERGVKGLWTFYQTGLAWIAEAVVGRPIDLSRDLRSSVNVKIYNGVGDGQGAHFDTNAVTALLYLTDVGPADGNGVRHMAPGTWVRDFSGREYEPTAFAGDLLLMQGRRVWHSVPANTGGHERITVPLNLYHPDDHDRPVDADHVIYGDPLPQASGAA